MLITRIKAEFFKTYHTLDMDLRVREDKPIILVGGANGGGKTTLFQAVCGALYGLKLRTEEQFQEYFNSGAHVRAASNGGGALRYIYLEIQFLGEIHGEEKLHVVRRRYELSAAAGKGKESGKAGASVVEYVTADFGGLKYAYNSAMSSRERARHQTEIAKMIKAHLPEELSRYFLFDAMESGALVRDDELQRIIRENIENVMGFGKYAQLARAAHSLARRFNAELLKAEQERKEYERALAERAQTEQRRDEIRRQRDEALAFRRAREAAYNRLAQDAQEERLAAKRREETQKEIERALAAERAFANAALTLAQNFEKSVLLPRIARAFRRDILLAVAAKNALERPARTFLDENARRAASKIAAKFFCEYAAGQLSSAANATENSPPENSSESFSESFSENFPAALFAEAELARGLEARFAAAPLEYVPEDAFAFLNDEETLALERSMQSGDGRAAQNLEAKRAEALHMRERLPELEATLEELRRAQPDNDYALLRDFERNERALESAERELERLEAALAQFDQRLHDFDIEGDDGKGSGKARQRDILQRLAAFFEQSGEQLLLAKKRQIERTIMQDLNVNLVAYKGCIDRVELSDALNDISFRIFHTSGNEIPLNQLNTASKQVVVQCLLKALREFGEYNPPVMIDTVMGALDEESRQTALVNYFPELSHQTILLSTDSEIRPEADWDKIAPFVARAYTLRRDKERQQTALSDGYFNKTLAPTDETASVE